MTTTTHMPLSAARAALGATQNDLAALLGVTSRGRINSWEKGRTPTPDSVSDEVHHLLRIYGSIANTYINAIGEAAKDHTDGPWLISCTAISQAADHITGRTTPFNVAHHIAALVQTALGKDGITVTITHE